MSTASAYSPAPSYSDEQLATAALQSFFKIAERWQLSNSEQRTLIGSPGRSTFYEWKKNGTGRLRPDTLERVSYILGIFKALQILLPDDLADAWLKRPNQGIPFGGRSALDKMLDGRVMDLADVRRYLDAQRA